MSFPELTKTKPDWKIETLPQININSQAFLDKEYLELKNKFSKVAFLDYQVIDKYLYYNSGIPSSRIRVQVFCSSSTFISQTREEIYVQGHYPISANWYDDLNER